VALSEEKLLVAINLWNEGKSASEIASVFKVSRGTVVGALYRARQRGLDVKQKGPTKPKVVEVLPEPKGKKVEIVKEVVAFAIVPQEELTVYHLQPGQCKYPTVMSKDSEQLFCGKKTERSYCDEHHKLCHVTTQPMRFRQLRKAIY